jgi:hypothetical protein
MLLLQVHAGITNKVRNSGLQGFSFEPQICPAAQASRLRTDEVVFAFYGWLPRILTSIHTHREGCNHFLRFDHSRLYYFSWNMLPSIEVAAVGSRFRLSFGSLIARLGCLFHDQI